MWDAAGFLLYMWDNYSVALPSSVILSNAIIIVLYQKPHAVFVYFFQNDNVVFGPCTQDGFEQKNKE